MKTRFRSESTEGCLPSNPARAGFLFSLLLALSAAALAGDADYPGWTDDTPPAGPVGEAVALGKRVLTHTPENAPAYTGNALNCTSCHLNAGRMPYSSPWVGVWGVFPEFRSRNARVNSMQDRINDCFERSMNGRALPNESPEMLGILAYMQWLSRGVPTGLSVKGRGFLSIRSPQPPDTERGKQVYAQKCASCHGAEGEGLYGAAGETVYPPLWGPRRPSSRAICPSVSAACLATRRPSTLLRFLRASHGRISWENPPTGPRAGSPRTRATDRARKPARIQFAVRFTPFSPTAE